uniref:triacylglycerol lipase n=1 Tax=Denticeps clupeoides TaxID=299321 RepID=A0AAY4CY73_9TELE
MLERSRDWNVSFAGCGFMAVYYVGVSCCLMERARGLLDNAAKISGASSGAITGAVIACRIPFVKSCESLMDMAREASKRNLSTLHPSFNLMRFVRDFLHRELPEDAHLLASGKLCVSLTRLTDGENVIASQFDSKEELIQAILCSCFFPVCCGMIPPAFRGVRYVDGALSDNLPYCKLKNTITVSPFAGESDICPKEGPYFYQEVRYFNVSINVNRNNLCRVSRIFLPPRPEVLAELCQSGYRDALQFLLENGPTQATCCDARLLSHTAVDGGDSTEAWPAECSCYEEEQHWWFDDLTVDLLPVHIKKVFCKACKDMYGPSVPVRHLLLVRMLLFLLVLFVLPVELVCALACRYGEKFYCRTHLTASDCEPKCISVLPKFVPNVVLFSQQFVCQKQK